MLRRERELLQLPPQPTSLPLTGAADATEARGHSPNCVRVGGRGCVDLKTAGRERERAGGGGGRDEMRQRGGTHGLFHVSGESCWAGSRREAAVAAARAAGVSDHA